MTAAQAQRAVIVHGPPDEATTTALVGSGLEIVTCVGDTTVWAPAAWRPTAPVPNPAMGGVEGRLLVTVAEAAGLLGVGRTTAYELINSGQLEVVHVGRAARVPVAAVEDLVERLRQDPTKSLPRRILRTVGAEPTTSQPSAAAQPSAS